MGNNVPSVVHVGVFSLAREHMMSDISRYQGGTTSNTCWSIRVIVISLIMLHLMPQISAAQTALYDGRTILRENRGNHIAEFVDGQYLIKFRVNTSVKQQNELLREFDFEMQGTPSPTGWIQVRGEPEKDTKAVLQRLSDDRRIDKATYDYLVRGLICSTGYSAMFVTPDDDDFDLQWYLHNNGTLDDWCTPDADIDAPEAWDIETGSSEVWIAILDTGIPVNYGSTNPAHLFHPDLKNSDSSRTIELYEWAAFYEESNEGLYDNRGHGTHVAGVIAATWDNNTGIAGTVPDGIHLVPAKVNLSDTGPSNWGALADAIETTVDNLCNNGPLILNISWGHPYEDYGSRMEDAVSHARSNGALLVCAVGNFGEGSQVDYPARYATSYDNVIAVGSSTWNDEVSVQSQRKSGYEEVSVIAPGGGDNSRVQNSQNRWMSNIWSTTVVEGTPGYIDNQGTSFATPQVVALAALLLSIEPEWSPSQVKDRILLCADDLGDYSYRQGAGRINAEKTIQRQWVLKADYNCGSDWSGDESPHIRPRGVDNQNYYGSHPSKTFGRGPVYRGDGELIYRVNLGAKQPDQIKLEVTYFTPNEPDDFERMMMAAPGGNWLKQSLMSQVSIHGPITVTNSPKTYQYSLDTDDTYFSGGNWLLDLIWHYEGGQAYGEELIYSTVSVVKVWILDWADPYAKVVNQSRNMQEEHSPQESENLFIVHSNYPNPFNPSTTIHFEISLPSDVRLSVFNSRGQYVREIYNGVLSAGSHSFLWDGCDAHGVEVGSGIYLYIIESQGKRIVRRMLLIR
ncbi:S8 family serine peptidase [Gemmatimonadota bacterium]